MREQIPRVAPGDPIRADAWNQLASVVSGGVSQISGSPQKVNHGFIRAKNITGDTVQRYRAYGIGECLIEELTDSSRVREIVLELVEWESGTVVVTQEPIADDAIGLVAVSGLTMLEVSDDGDDETRQATPGTDGICDPGSGPITLLMPRPEEGGFVLAALGVGGSGGQVVFPPSGGIPAGSLNTAKTQLTLGKANCSVAKLEPVSGGGKRYVKQSETVEVFNAATAIVGADGKPLQCKLTIDGIWLVDVEDCD